MKRSSAIICRRQMLVGRAFTRRAARWYAGRLVTDTVAAAVVVAAEVCGLLALCGATVANFHQRGPAAHPVSAAVGRATRARARSTLPGKARDVGSIALSNFALLTSWPLAILR